MNACRCETSVFISCPSAASDQAATLLTLQTMHLFGHSNSRTVRDVRGCASAAGRDCFTDAEAPTSAKLRCRARTSHQSSGGARCSAAAAAFGPKRATLRSYQAQTSQSGSGGVGYSAAAAVGLSQRGSHAWVRPSLAPALAGSGAAGFSAAHAAWVSQASRAPSCSHAETRRPKRPHLLQEVRYT